MPLVPYCRVVIGGPAGDRGGLVLLQFNQHGFRMPTLRTFERARFEFRAGGLDKSKSHHRAALGARWPHDPIG